MYIKIVISPYLYYSYYCVQCYLWKMNLTSKWTVVIHFYSVNECQFSLKLNFTRQFNFRSFYIYLQLISLYKFLSSQSNWVLVALDTILPQLAGSGIANADRSSFCLLLHKCTWPFSSRWMAKSLLSPFCFVVFYVHSRYYIQWAFTTQ